MLTLVGGPDYCSSRSFKEFWNFGHILLFGILTYTIWFHSHWFNGLVYRKKFLVIVLITMFLSIIIEFSQFYFSNGTPDIADVRRNFLGCAFILFFIKKDLINRYILICFRIVFVLLICYELINPVIVLADEYRARRDFPILTDFESDLELSRWGEDAWICITDDFSYSGKKSLKVKLTTSKYSGVSLNYFPKDWSKYLYLNYSLFNPDNSNLQMTCRINDFKHRKNGNRYHDRFNQRIILKPGWNHYSINLYDVKKAPKERLMEMDQIQKMSIFAKELQEERVVYLDYVRLSK